ncbi:MAG: hypothetical protein QM778_18170 [Myxococcales bacterium]
MLVQGPTMIFRHVDGVWVGVHTAEPPTVDEWTALCGEVAHLRRETRGVIIYTEGGGPDSKQRELLRAALQNTPQHVAVLTHSSVVRLISTTLNWLFGRQTICAFAPSDLDGALAFLAQHDGALPRATVVEVMGDSTLQLGLKPPPWFTSAA